MPKAARWRYAGSHPTAASGVVWSASFATINGKIRAAVVPVPQHRHVKKVATRVEFSVH
jgi:hypothetical protein